LVIPVSPLEAVFRDEVRQERAYELWALLEKDPADAESRLELARTLIDERLGEEATSVSRVGMARHPKDPRFLVEMARSIQLVSDRNARRAVLMLRRAGRMDGAFTSVQIHLGFAYLRTGRPMRAIGEFQRALQTTTDEADRLSAYVGLIACYRESGDEVRLDEHLDAAREIMPDLTLVYVNTQMDHFSPPAIESEETGSSMAMGTDPREIPLDARIRAIRERIYLNQLAEQGKPE
jgi:Flp pilus assembly protein TadD